MSDEPKFEPVDAFQLRHRGGKWLAAARSWLQHRRTVKGVHGDRITWGDQNAIFNISAYDVEELAAHVAAGALNEHGDAREHIEYLRKKRLDAEINASGLAARVERLENVLRDALGYVEINAGLKGRAKMLAEIEDALPKVGR